MHRMCGFVYFDSSTANRIVFSKNDTYYHNVVKSNIKTIA